MGARSVISVTGTDREDFLQNLVTNDVSRTRDGLVWAALLTPQGKYLADFFLVPAEDAILIDVAESLATGLMQRLAMYKLRADVTLKALDLVVARGLGPTPDGAFTDPRHPDLGWRAYDGRAGETHEGRAAGKLHTNKDGEGLAYLRFDRATEPMRAGEATVIATLPEPPKDL